jgi:hypothetical protein
MPKADKKQRHKAKREAKRRQAQRQKSISPIKRLADAPGEVEYWMSEDFEDRGQTQIFVFKRAASLTGIACFLVDRGVVGLKDAWTRANIERSEFDEMLEVSSGRGIAMRRASIDEVRRMVAGGLRWAHQNGMRLPKEWVKTASLIGGVGDWMNADVSAFVKEFAGHPDDLRQRLISEPFDSYIQRDDIHFVFSDMAPYLDQDTGEYVDREEEDLGEEELEAIAADIPEEELEALAAGIAPAATALAQATATWLSTLGGVPSPLLTEAWQSVALTAMLTKVAMSNADTEKQTDFFSEMLESLINRRDLPQPAEFQRAVEQALDYLNTDPDMVTNAIVKYGIADEVEED